MLEGNRGPGNRRRRVRRRALRGWGMVGGARDDRRYRIRLDLLAHEPDRSIDPRALPREYDAHSVLHVSGPGVNLRTTSIGRDQRADERTRSAPVYRRPDRMTRARDRQEGNRYRTSDPAMAGERRSSCL